MDFSDVGGRDMFLVEGEFLDFRDTRIPRRRSAAAPRNTYVRFWPGKPEDSVVSERTGMVCASFGVRKRRWCGEEKGREVRTRRAGGVAYVDSNFRATRGRICILRQWVSLSDLKAEVQTNVSRDLTRMGGPWQMFVLAAAISCQGLRVAFCNLVQSVLDK